MLVVEGSVRSMYTEYKVNGAMALDNRTKGTRQVKPFSSRLHLVPVPGMP